MACSARLAGDGVDFSPVGLAKAQRLAARWDVEVIWVESAVEEWVPPPVGFGLVVMLYLQLPQPERATALEVAASAAAPGGTLIVVAHDMDNLRRASEVHRTPTFSTTSPMSRRRLVRGRIERRGAEQAVRVVDTDSGPREAIDTLVRAKRAA